MMSCGRDHQAGLCILSLVLALNLLGAGSARAGLIVNEYLTRNSSGILDEDGDHSDWIELLNDGDAPLPLQGFWLSDEEDLIRKWELPPLTLPVGAYLLLYASGKGDVTHPFHTNFKLAADGEILILGDAEDQTIERIVIGALPADISRGRLPSGGPDWYYFPEPSPGEPNDTAPYTGFTAIPTATPPGGFGSLSMPVQLACSTPGVTIRYEIGGAPVTENSPVYTNPITIDGNTVLRAAAFAPDLLPGGEINESYLAEDGSVLARLSLVTDPPGFWSEDTGSVPCLR